MRKIETLCVQGDGSFSFDDPVHAISFPLYQTASFGHTCVGEKTGYDYTRQTNPTRAKLEQVMSALEHAADTMAFTSGMAAISCCLERFSPGDHIVCSEDLYGGTNRLLKRISQKNGLTCSLVDTTDLAEVETALRPQTRAVFLETPSNPTMRVSDIAAICALVQPRGIEVIVDNTFLSPYFQNPLALGADLVVHSGTKFLGGHNDTLAGFLCVKDADMAMQYREIYKTTGGGLSPFDSWLMLRGIKTLALRMERQQSNALVLAQWLCAHPKVSKVHYVGLPDHPSYALSCKQARGFGSMISFHVDSAQTAHRLLERVSLVVFAESLGGVETLITYPRVQTHPDVSEQECCKLGITDTLLRLSVGIENAEDLIADLAQGLED